MGQAASKAIASDSKESLSTACSLQSDDTSSQTASQSTCGSKESLEIAIPIRAPASSSESFIYPPAEFSSGSTIDEEESNDTSEAESEDNDTTMDEEDYQSSDDEDSAPKSKKVIITDFVATDCLPTDNVYGSFSKSRATPQEWNCACELFPALLNIEGSPEQDGIGLAIITCHGKMEGNDQYLCLSKSSKCKRCISPIPLTKVMAALNSTKRNIACALLACRTREGHEIGEDNPVDPSSLATRFVALLQPCGAGSKYTRTIIVVDETRELMLKTLYECKAVRDAMESLRGQFIKYLDRIGENIGTKLNETPIEVFMHKDWMRQEETNEDGFVPPKRPKLEELSSLEKMQAEFAIYKQDPSHEKRVRALEEVRVLVEFYWYEIPSDRKEIILNDFLEALDTERDNKLIEILVQVAVEAAMNSIDRTTGSQTWIGFGRFIENTFKSDNVSLKMSILAILEKVPTLFGTNVESALSFIKATLNDDNKYMQTAAIRSLFAYLHVKKIGDLSPLIPDLMNIAEKRMVVAKKENEFHLIGTINKLAHRLPESFPTRSLVSIVKKGLQSPTSDRLKEQLMSSLTLQIYRSEDWSVNKSSSVFRDDPESLSNIVVILRSCSASASPKLKKHAFRIIRSIPEALRSNPTAAADFFKKLFDDSNEKIRKCATFFYLEAIRKHKDDENMQTALSPLIPTLIKLADKCDRALDDLSKVKSFEIMLPYLNDLINLCTMITRPTEGDTNLRRFVDALDILKNLFSAHWSLCWPILGVDGISSLLKQLSEKAALLTSKREEEELYAKHWIDDTKLRIADFIIVLTRNVCPDAPSFYEKLLGYTGLRACAADIILRDNIIQMKKGHSVEALLNVLPFVMKAIDGEAMLDYFKDEMIELVETRPDIIDKEHIRGLVECILRVDIGSFEEWDYKKRELNENTLRMKRILTALKEPNVLQTALSVIHSFMQNEDWTERCIGLQGLVALAKEGNGSMDEHMEKIAPLLKDANPLVRSLACLALKEIADHFWSKYTESEKEILLNHLTPLIDGIIECSLKEMNRIGKGKKEAESEENLRYTDPSHLEHILPIVYKLTESAEATTRFYDKIMNLLKSFLVHELEKHFYCVQDIIGVLKCISHVGGIVGKETFFPAAEEVVHILLAVRAGIVRGKIFKVISRFFGSDFALLAPLLPLVISNCITDASAAPHPELCSCGYDCAEMIVPHGRREADEVLLTMAKSLGESFSPYVDDVFKAAILRLKDASFDYDCWSFDIFPLLLDSIESQGVVAKRKLWTEFWPALKLAIEEINMNAFSAKALESVTRSIEKLGSEGITDEETAEIRELISHELEAIKMRRVKGQDEDSEVGGGQALYVRRHLRKRDRKSEKELINAIKEINRVGESILGASFTIDVVPMEDDGVEKPKEDTDCDEEKGTAIV